MPTVGQSNQPYPHPRRPHKSIFPFSLHFWKGARPGWSPSITSPSLSTMGLPGEAGVTALELLNLVPPDTWES